MKDNKFYDGMTESIIERDLVDKNIYFIFGNEQDEFKIMDPYPNCMFGGEIELNKIDLAIYDKAIFHNLNDEERISFLANAGAKKGKCKTYWRLWTGDNYSMVRLADIMQQPIYLNHSRLYDSEKDIRTAYAYFVNSLKNIRAKHRYRKRYLECVKALSYIDYAMNWNEEEVDMVRERYPAFNAEYMSHGYHSRLLDYELPPIKQSYGIDNSVKICVGHSGYQYLKHVKILKLIKEVMKSKQNNNYKIICPLSYGDQEYIRETIDCGTGLFGNKFRPITEFLEYSKYIELLNSCDVFIYGQQIPSAAGNIFTAIRMGKRVILPKNNPMNRIISNTSVTVFNIEDLKKGNTELLTPLSIEIAERNIKAWAVRSEWKRELNKKTLLEIIC